jgi:hypothetical protein
MSRRPPRSAPAATLLAGDRGILVFAAFVVIGAASATSLATLATQFFHGVTASKSKTAIVQALVRPVPAAPAPADPQE